MIPEEMNPGLPGGKARLYSVITDTPPERFERRKNGAIYVATYDLPELKSVSVAVWKNGDGWIYIDGDNEKLYGCMFQGRAIVVRPAKVS